MDRERIREQIQLSGDAKPEKTRSRCLNKARTVFYYGSLDLARRKNENREQLEIAWKLRFLLQKEAVDSLNLKKLLDWVERFVHGDAELGFAHLIMVRQEGKALKKPRWQRDFFLIRCV